MMNFLSLSVSIRGDFMFCGRVLIRIVLLNHFPVYLCGLIPGDSFLERDKKSMPCVFKSTLSVFMLQNNNHGEETSGRQKEVVFGVQKLWHLSNFICRS